MYSDSLFCVMGWLAIVRMGAESAVTAGVFAKSAEVFVKSAEIAEAVGARERGDVLIGRVAEMGDALLVGIDSVLGWLLKALAMIAPRP